MDATQTAVFREQLLAQQRAVLAQLAAQRGGTIGRAEAAAEHFGRPEDSRAQVATDRELEFALDAHETEQLAAIDAALSRIAADTYGECTDCGADIAIGRLQVAPEASRCLACQDSVEHQRRPG
ncbi:TraR/DksA family transcriptional regulator [Acidovorax sp. BL-A-41-H1]|uniref:TraR/DksA family transcriptional regulator n=1 Tax=Acidovorax sp. BL-A-41-H1 TaxID=3421102 RepID=UPI003F7A2BCC